MTNDDIEIIKRETVFQGYFRMDRYRLRHMTYEGDWSPPLDREVFERGHAIGVLPYDAHRDEVILLEQFRLGGMTAPDVSAWQIETVAGIIEPGQSPEEAARRECFEESGLNPSELREIHRYLVSPGGTSETVRLYCGRVDATGAGGVHGLAEEGEYLKVWPAHVDEAFALMDSGKIENSMMLIALMWLKINHAELRAAWRADEGHNVSDA